MIYMGKYMGKYIGKKIDYMDSMDPIKKEKIDPR